MTIMNRRMDIYIIRCTLAAAVLTAAACSMDDEQSAEEPVAVSFGAVMDRQDNATRASANIINTDGLQASAGGFGVFGCYTGLHDYSSSDVRPDFMYNQQVVYSTSTWEYTPLKYWPNGEGEATGHTGSNIHKVSFFAYAPYSDNDISSPSSNPAGYCIPSFSEQQEVGNPWLTYRLIPQSNIDHQVDLLCAVPLLNQQKPADAANSRLMFNFKHALACVGDYVKLMCSDNMKTTINAKLDGSTRNRVEVYLTDVSIDYTLTEKARLILWNGDGKPYWQTILSEMPQTTRTIHIVESTAQLVYAQEYGSVATTTQWDIDGKGIFYIPVELQGYAQQARVNVTYQVRYYDRSESSSDEPAVTGSSSITLSNYSDAYQPGKHLYINVTIDNVAVRVSGAIAPWSITTQTPSVEESNS